MKRFSDGGVADGWPARDEQSTHPNIRKPLVLRGLMSHINGVCLTVYYKYIAFRMTLTDLTSPLTSLPSRALMNLSTTPGKVNIAFWPPTFFF